LVTFLSSLTLRPASSFVPTATFTTRQNHGVPLFAEVDADLNEELLTEIRGMRVKELKAELSSRKVSTADVFEKEELVQRLYKARQSDEGPGVSSGATSAPVSSPDIARAPLYFCTMDAGMSVASVNRNGGITILPSAKPFASIQIELDSGYRIPLLLDTACSGVVLRPSVVRNYNLPSYSTPVTMTAAGGTESNTGLTQIGTFRLGENSYGPLPAAVQDIGSLPTALDGIMGLSFLGQFACTELDFQEGVLSLYKTDRNPPVPSDLSVVAEAEMSMTKLGVLTADVILDGRGPVKMLVDTGAANSFLNWKGVSDLSLSRDSPEISRMSSPMGAMGADNISMELTHSLKVSQNVNVGRRSADPGLSIRDEVSIDIGDIAVLDALRDDQVGGILGIDILMRSKVLRMVTNGPVKKITLLAQGTESNDAFADKSEAKVENVVVETAEVKIDSQDTVADVAPENVEVKEKKVKKKKKRRY